MKTLSQFKDRNVHVVLTDIDGTLTQQGRLPAQSYQALWNLANAGIKIIPVTGRPAGWCELIARLWPVDGVIGENGAFYFRLQGGQMRRHFARSEAERKNDRLKLRGIRKEILKHVPGCAVASDQFSRLFDLAIDFAEDVPPLNEKEIKKIVTVFEKHGATAKVSNIHVNGWFGEYDKVSCAQTYLLKEFGLSKEKMQFTCAFVGDSPNDEPMFKFFPHSFAVANIRRFVNELKHPPRYVSEKDEGDGFVQVSERLLTVRD